MARGWTGSTARQNTMAPIVAIVLCIVVVNALLALWTLGNGPGQKGTDANAETEVTEEAVPEEVEQTKAEDVEKTKAVRTRLKDPDNVLVDNEEEFTLSIENWLEFQGFKKTALVTVKKDTSLNDESWPLRCTVSGADDEVLAGKMASGWGFAWAKVVTEEVEAARAEAAAEEEARRKAEEERARAEAEAAAQSYSEETYSESYEYEDSTYVEETFDEAYVGVYDTGWLSSYVPSDCAAGIGSALVAWAEDVPGLRNADSGYLVASTVSGSWPCSFVVVIPSGMVDDNLDWVDVSVSCYWDGSFSFSYSF